ALDARAAPGTVLLRPDLATLPPAALWRLITPGRPSNGLVLPGRPARLAVTAAVRPPRGVHLGTLLVTLSVQDGWGIVYSVPAGSLPPDGRHHPLAADLTRPRPPAASPPRARPATAWPPRGGRPARPYPAAARPPRGVHLGPLLVTLSVQDGWGIVYSVPAGSLPTDGRHPRLAADLTGPGQPAAAQASGRGGARHPLPLPGLSPSHPLPRLPAA